MDCPTRATSLKMIRGNSCRKSVPHLCTTTSVPKQQIFSSAGCDNRFNATASLSLNATYSEIHINSYVWSFGDGATNSTPNPITNHIFGSSGQYNVNLTVIDANGDRGSSRLLVAVGQALGAL